jgi:hypothetical protein
VNPFFDWLKDSGTQAMLVLVGTVAAIVAALGTIHFGRKSLTKGDLRPVEENTAHLEEVRERITNIDARSKGQMERDQLISKANRVSVSVSGDGPSAEPLVVHLTLKDASVTIKHIELINDANSFFGSAPCNRVGELEFTASIEPKTVLSWFNGGVRIQHITRVRVNLRVFMLMETQEVFRSMVAVLSNEIITPTGFRPGWLILGDV